MEIGIYEQLINHLFKAKIEALQGKQFYIGKQSITADNAAAYLSNYLYQIIQQVIESLPSDEQKMEKCVQMINDIVVQVGRKFDVEDYCENLLEAPASILTAVVDQTKVDYSDVSEYIKNIMPATRLTKSALFTGRNNELNMASELRREILSSDEICLLVSFIKKSGLDLIKQQLNEAVNAGRKLRVITTTYMGASQYKAIAELASMANTQVKISYNSDTDRLHAKAYLFLRNTQFHTAYVGSSNLSEAALRNGLEWNIKVTQSESPQIIANIRNSFETYWADESFETFVPGRDDERLQFELSGEKSYKPLDYSVLDLMKAKEYQQEVLERLTAERELHGHYKNLVVAATGTGKTVIAAFDYKRFRESEKRANFLFVVHREEIILQAKDTFCRVLQDENFGEIWAGGSKPTNWTQVFASKDSLNNSIDDLPLSSDYYDYIIIDEAHHISAPSYQKILQRFKPKILMGLTATPERMDGVDILEYFDGCISAEIRLTTALNNGLLCPFHYYGITDNTDLKDVRWERGKFVASELSKVYTSNDRRTGVIWNAMEKYLDDCRDVQALCFCVDQEHARYMNAKFLLAGLKSGVLTSENAADRGRLLRALQRKEINYLFVVDMFNEGIDIPNVDTILFLRPTESLTIFLQQLGRGLRKAENKPYLTVLDFVGQYRAEFNFTDRFRALMGKTSMSVKEEVERDFPQLPLNCQIHLEKKAKQYILENINNSIASFKATRIIASIKKFKQELDMPLTLLNFMKVYDMPLERMYKIGSWQTLCRLAEIDVKTPIAFDDELKYAVTKKWLSTESYTYFSFIHSLAEKNFDVKIDKLNSLERKMCLMLYYDFYDKPGQFNSVQEFIDYLHKHPIVADEIKDLMQIFMNRCEVVEKKDNSALSFVNPLCLHGRYTKAQIQVAIETSRLDKKSSVREGVERNNDLNLEAMYVDIIKDREEGSNTNYNDFALTRELFHWETQNKVTPESAAGQAYINQKRTMLLFVREQNSAPDYKSRTMGYIYLGQVTFVSSEGSKPMEIVWKLKTPMPASVFSFAAKYAAVAQSNA